MNGNATPLTLTLSPGGRGDSVVRNALSHPLTRRLPILRHASHRARFPLPKGERVRVRGQMQQNDLSKAHARDLRQRMTDAERLLWYHLRDRRLMGLKFRRQVPLGPFIADFYCAEHRLILEADGSQHTADKDEDRDAYLAAMGFRTLRFQNHDILTNLPGCLARLAGEIGQ